MQVLRGAIRLASVGACVLLAIAGAGCGSGAPAVHTVPVTGTVTLDDKPIAGAVVRFFDVSGKSLASAGATDASGHYTLGFATYTGAVPGKYKVVIEYLVGIDGKPVVPEEGLDANMLAMEGKAKQGLHENYSSFEATKLEAEVKDGDKNNFEFKLKSDGT